MVSAHGAVSYMYVPVVRIPKPVTGNADKMSKFMPYGMHTVAHLCHM